MLLFVVVFFGQESFQQFQQLLRLLVIFHLPWLEMILPLKHNLLLNTFIFVLLNLPLIQ